jgi:hypothetical protein
MTHMFSQEGTNLIITGRTPSVGRQGSGGVTVSGGQSTFLQADCIPSVGSCQMGV